MVDKYLKYLEERISVLKSLSEEYYQEYCALSEKDDSSSSDAFSAFYDFGYAASVLSEVLSDFRSL